MYTIARTRRDLLAALSAGPLVQAATEKLPPAPPVALARCQSYDEGLDTTLSTMFDQLGGLGRVVKNKTVSQVIGISQDGSEGTNEFNNVIGVSFPTLLDTAANGYQASNAFGISNVPSLFVVETDGTVSAAEQGFTKPLLEELDERAGVTVFQPTEKVPLYKPG